MRRFAAAALAAAALFLSGRDCLAQKVGYVDSKKVLDRYRGSAEIRQEVNRAIDSWNREIGIRKQALDSLERELEGQNLVISSERRKAKREEIKKKRDELEALVHEVYDPGGKADLKNRELSKPLVEKIGTIVKKVALDNNLLLVLDSSIGGVVYAAKDLDITDQVLEELDKEEGRAGRAVASVVLLPLTETDEESARKKYGRQVQDLLWTSVDRGGLLKPQTKKEVDDLIKDKGLTNKPISESRAYELAKILNDEFMTLGTVAVDQENGQITIALKLYNVDTKALLLEATEIARDDNELPSTVDKLAQRLGQKAGEQ